MTLEIFFTIIANHWQFATVFTAQRLICTFTSSKFFVCEFRVMAVWSIVLFVNIMVSIRTPNTSNEATYLKPRFRVKIKLFKRILAFLF